MHIRSALLFLWLACVNVASGEILIAPPAKEKTNAPAVNEKNNLDEASVLRNKAKAYGTENPQPVPPNGIPASIQKNAAPEIDEGVLLPRGDETSAISRARNHESSRDSLPASQETPPNSNNPLSADRPDIRMQLEKNRFKANQYMNNKAAPGSVSPNNDPVVECMNTGNVSGRIGDDTLSGKEIIVIREGKQITVRCK